MDHKTSTKAASDPDNRKEDDKREPSGLRRSKRNVKRKDYKTMHEGTNQALTEGSTEFSAHVASDTHEKEDLQYSILYTEDNWFKRGIKEAIAIRKLKPNLNLDDGRYSLSAMYDQLIRSRLMIKIPETGMKDNTVETTEEDSRPACRN